MLFLIQKQKETKLYFGNLEEMYSLELVKRTEEYYLFKVRGKKVWFIFVNRSDLGRLLEEDFYFV